ncbi:MAG: transposase [Bacteroidetes bacterium]|nr:MAG: transposase [Bacteroidota bacterium]
MSRSYKFHNPAGMYFVSFATVGWIDVFTREVYRNVIIDSIKYCQKSKGLELFAWCLMTIHVHLIARAADGFTMPGIIRDMKKFTSKKIIEAIQTNEQESRKEWMLAIFKSAGEYNSNNKDYQFWRQDNKSIELWSVDVIEQKLDYIHKNPVEMGFVSEPEHWKYSSAIDYSGGKGLLELIYV